MLVYRDGKLWWRTSLTYNGHVVRVVETVVNPVAMLDALNRMG